MAAQINSKEDAIRVLTEKINQFADELGDITSGLDPKQSAKMMAQLRNALENSVATKLWTYAGFLVCIVIIIIVFVFVGYYKLYKPMADKERTLIAKKCKREEKRRAKKH